MILYQVEYRTYLIERELDPPDWSAAPISSVTRNIGEAREMLRFYVERVRVRAQSFATGRKRVVILETRLAATDGRVINTRKERIEPLVERVKG